MPDKRDYYDILGVSKRATDEQLKIAFRKKALEYHPDRNKSKDAEEKFKEINEAYQILSDSEKRAKYDQFGHAGVTGTAGTAGFGGFGDIFDSFFGGSQSSSNRKASYRGADLEYPITLEFEESVFGGEKGITIEKLIRCDTCKPINCSNCSGTGQIKRAQRTMFGQFTQVVNCQKCSGTGDSYDSGCQKCKGSGRYQDTKNIFVTIPQGIDDGMQIRLQGEGEPGFGAGQDGDLYIVVKVQEHNIFVRSGNNIEISIELNVPTLVLGGVIKIPTIQGEESLTIAPGTQSGQIFRLRGKGIVDVREQNKRGDELIKVFVKIPKKLTKEQREIYQKLQAISEDDTKKSVSDWVSRIKDRFS